MTMLEDAWLEMVLYDDSDEEEEEDDDDEEEDTDEFDDDDEDEDDGGWSSSTTTTESVPPHWEHALKDAPVVEVRLTHLHGRALRDFLPSPALLMRLTAPRPRLIVHFTKSARPCLGADVLPLHRLLSRFECVDVRLDDWRSAVALLHVCLPGSPMVHPRLVSVETQCASDHPHRVLGFAADLFLAVHLGRTAPPIVGGIRLTLPASASADFFGDADGLSARSTFAEMLAQRSRTTLRPDILQAGLRMWDEKRLVVVVPDAAAPHEEEEEDATAGD